jgi:hypothetical protein
MKNFEKKYFAAKSRVIKRLYMQNKQLQEKFSWHKNLN